MYKRQVYVYENGKVVQIVTEFYRNGQVVTEVVREPGPDGKFQKVKVTHYSYDDKGNLVGITVVHYENDKKVQAVIFGPDGKPKKIIHFGPDGKPNKVTIFDANGNPIDFYIDSKGNPIPVSYARLGQSADPAVGSGSGLSLIHI